MRDAKGYAECCAQVQRAAQQFICEQGADGLLFIPPPEGIAIISGLVGRTVDALGANAKSRALLRSVDGATKQQATLLMAQAVIEAMQLPVDTTRSPDVWAFALSQGQA